MNQIVANAYTVTSNLFGPESGIPWWVWVFVVGAILFKLLVPAPKTARDLADERDRMLLQELAGKGDGGGKKGKKKDKKKKK
ncbi:hypothetical protein [Actinoplanes subtropicus]|uniref:hypothetical protein n=1 Tax=Actinoplanes subtropicus TaxID=543632 RepID=UPI0012F73F94|nr:hypothetical protein [Actinoplanes subtropicus]